jgi:hypothetical protein
MFGSTETAPPRASRIAGRGRLLRSLRTLLRRVEKYGVHRASTPEERRWSIRLADTLEAAWEEALKDLRAESSLAAADERARIGRKASREATW